MSRVVYSTRCCAPARAKLRELTKMTAVVNSLEEDYEELTDAELRAKTAEFKQRLDDGEDTLDTLLPEAFAAVREASSAPWGSATDVQIMGGGALHKGNIAEMGTGEGKTLVATLPSYLNALSGKGVHIVTVNDYLAQRDAETMGRIHHFLGLKVGVILATMSPCRAPRAYNADITYGTNNEFGFDYLRDNMAWSLGELVQRGHNFAIVGRGRLDPHRRGAHAAHHLRPGRARAQVVCGLRPPRPAPGAGRGPRGGREEAHGRHPGTRGGEGRGPTGIENLYLPRTPRWSGSSTTPSRPKSSSKRDRDYVVLNGEVMIVDEHTGRILSGRRYNEGLHQALEAKEGVEIKAENQTLATITLQNFFRLYDKLSGMTGTAPRPPSSTAPTAWV